MKMTKKKKFSNLLSGETVSLLHHLVVIQNDDISTWVRRSGLLSNLKETGLDEERDELEQRSLVSPNPSVHELEAERRCGFSRLFIVEQCLLQSTGGNWTTNPNSADTYIGCKWSN